MAFDNSSMKAVWAALPGPTPTKCELPRFLAALGQAALGQAVRRWKALDLGSLIWSFSMVGQKINMTYFKFLPENLEKFRMTELYDAPLEGSTIFLSRSSTCRMLMESYRLAEWKYAILSMTGRKTKKLLRSLFLWMDFKHGLLEGRQFYFNTAP